MKLHTKLQNALHPESLPPVVLIHGLFGSLDNLGVLARDLRQHRNVLQIDLRNHGHSPRSDSMDYVAMAQDLRETLDANQINKAVIIGHSMGGKVAMAFSALAPEYIDALIIIDMAPVTYTVRRHDAIFNALNAVSKSGVTTRQDAITIMRQSLPEEDDVIAFLLKSFDQGLWTFNVPVLEAQYHIIQGWQPAPPCYIPALFILGGESSYVDTCYRDTLLAQFPAARATVIAGAGHWVHAEKPASVLRAIHRFLAS